MANMTKRFCILFYMSILGVLIAGCFGSFEGLYAAPKVIETFEAGPVKESKRHVVKVKTHFEWNAKNPCPCEGDEAPCIKSFLDKNQPEADTVDFQVNQRLNDNSEKYRGTQIVPSLVKESSVRIIVIPFCKQSSSEK